MTTTTLKKSTRQRNGPLFFCCCRAGDDELCFFFFWFRRTGTLRALLTGKSIRDKLRGTRSRSREEDKSTLGAVETPGRGGVVVSPPSGERRFSRLFSLRRSSTNLPSPTAGCNSVGENGSCSPLTNTATTTVVADSMAKTASPSGRPLPLPQLLEEDEIMAGLGLGPGSSTLGSLFQRRHQPPTLPPIPHNLTAEQLKRRYIVATIIHSENSYVASLQRLVNVSPACYVLFLFPPSDSFLLVIDCWQWKVTTCFDRVETRKWAVGTLPFHRFYLLICSLPLADSRLLATVSLF